MLSAPRRSGVLTARRGRTVRSAGTASPPGGHKSCTRPSPGNHDYNTSGATGYYNYFGTSAGPSGRGYYSFDLGNWHVVSLNSNISMSAGSTQEQWLRADLAATSKPCTLAYWHHPLFTSSSNHAPSTSTRPLYQALYDYNADAVVWGHNHVYERFAPGLRSFVAGMGGASHYGFGTIQPNSEARNSSVVGRSEVHPALRQLRLAVRAGGRANLQRQRHQQLPLTERSRCTVRGAAGSPPAPRSTPLPSRASPTTHDPRRPWTPHPTPALHAHAPGPGSRSSPSPGPSPGPGPGPGPGPRSPAGPRGPATL
ncbi:metallophosphoesterase family protein [Micromonospora taraxaci]